MFFQQNKQLFLGNHTDIFVFDSFRHRFDKEHEELFYISVNFAGIICKKSADFLFGETTSYSAGKEDESTEQKVIERLVENNELNILNYQTSLSNAYRGESKYTMIADQFDQNNGSTYRSINRRC